MPCCAEQPELQRCRQQSHKAQEQEGTYPSALYFPLQLLFPLLPSPTVPWAEPGHGFSLAWGRNGAQWVQPRFLHGNVTVPLAGPFFSAVSWRFLVAGSQV